MMHPPLAVSPELFDALDLPSIAAELSELARSAPDGKAARTLVKSPQLTVVAMGLKSGATLKEHAAPGTVLVVPILGRATFAALGSGAEANVEARRCLAMGPGLRHAVTASDDAVFLLVIAARPDA